MELAESLGAFALPFWLMPVKLDEFDIVVCATSAPDTVVSLAATQAAMRKRPARPLFFIDLALPRDVDAAAAKLQNVFLYNLDDLAQRSPTRTAPRARSRDRQMPCAAGTTRADGPLAAHPSRGCSPHLSRRLRAARTGPDGLM